jgi:hypothetical protein
LGSSRRRRHRAGGRLAAHENGEGGHCTRRQCRPRTVACCRHPVKKSCRRRERLVPGG